ncbi:hypothetical protein V8E52_011609 [Russula decolorans]
MSGGVADGVKAERLDIRSCLGLKPDSGAICESAEVAEVEVDVVGNKDEDGNRDGTDDRVDVHNSTLQSSLESSNKTRHTIIIIIIIIIVTLISTPYLISVYTFSSLFTCTRKCKYTCATAHPHTALHSADITTTINNSTRRHIIITIVINSLQPIHQSTTTSTNMHVHAIISPIPIPILILIPNHINLHLRHLRALTNGTRVRLQPQA